MSRLFTRNRYRPETVLCLSVCGSKGQRSRCRYDTTPDHLQRELLKQFHNVNHRAGPKVPPALKIRTGGSGLATRSTHCFRRDLERSGDQLCAGSRELSLRCALYFGRKQRSRTQHSLHGSGSKTVTQASTSTGHQLHRVVRLGLSSPVVLDVACAFQVTRIKVDCSR